MTPAVHATDDHAGTITRRAVLASAPAACLVGPAVAQGDPSDPLILAIRGYWQASHAYNLVPDPSGEMDSPEHLAFEAEWTRCEKLIEALPIRSAAGLVAYCDHLMELGSVFVLGSDDVQKIAEWARWAAT